MEEPDPVSPTERTLTAPIKAAQSSGNGATFYAASDPRKGSHMGIVYAFYKDDHSRFLYASFTLPIEGTNHVHFLRLLQR